MKCVVCGKNFCNHEDEEVCRICKRIASRKTIEYFRKQKKGALKKTRKEARNEEQYLY